MAPPQNLRAAGDRIETLLGRLQASVDASSFEAVEELLRLVSELYGAALGRVVEIVEAAAGRPGVYALADDDLVASLLLVHELHPRSLRERVEAALAGVRPILERHAGDVALVGVDPGGAAVRLRLLGNCDGCPSSSVTLESAVERAIRDAAPEVGVIEVERPSVSTPVSLGRKMAFDACPTEVAAR
jgi:Fe-S cluster biogenesis protein NfuA